MIETVQEESVVDESRFARMSLPQLRAELESYRRSWRRGHTSWRLLKSVERIITGEIKFRESDPIR